MYVFVFTYTCMLCLCVNTCKYACIIHIHIVYILYVSMYVYRHTYAYACAVVVFSQFVLYKLDRFKAATFQCCKMFVVLTYIQFRFSISNSLFVLFVSLFVCLSSCYLLSGGFILCVFIFSPLLFALTFALYYAALLLRIKLK